MWLGRQLFIRKAVRREDVKRVRLMTGICANHCVIAYVYIGELAVLGEIQLT